MSLETTLLELENELWRANREGDGAFYEEHLRPDALVVSRYGVVERDAMLPRVQENRNPYLRAELTEPRVLSLTEDSALITYRSTVTAQANTEEITFEVLATSVYVREGGTWRGAFHQQTAL